MQLICLTKEVITPSVERKGVGEKVGICFTGIQLIDEVQRERQPRYNVGERTWAHVCGNVRLEKDVT